MERTSAKKDKPSLPIELPKDAGSSTSSSLLFEAFSCCWSPAKKSVSRPPKNTVDWFGWLLMFGIVIISVVSCPSFRSNTSAKPTIQEVFFCGWMTAVSTGLGVLPFVIFKEPDSFFMGVSNAVAGGMMLAASFSLVREAIAFDEVEGLLGYHSVFRALLGIGLGVVFILVTKHLLEHNEHLHMGDIQGASAQRMILIILVMTLHSMSEGIGIGVSFGGEKGKSLGQWISLSLAVHNVPEGLAVALTLNGKVSKLRSSLWAIATSIPQPLMALPAYFFVDRFLAILPTGLGFAAGAMSYVAVFELLTEAVEDCGKKVSFFVGVASFILLLVLQEFLHVDAL